MMSPLLPEPPPVNAAATLPIMSETEGRIAPAIMAASVPTKSSSLSWSFRKLKNLVRGICSGA